MSEPIRVPITRRQAEMFEAALADYRVARARLRAMGDVVLAGADAAGTVDGIDITTDPPVLLVGPPEGGADG